MGSPFWYKKPSNVNEVVDSFGGYEPSQPSQKYPFKPIYPPRMDNKNQPWYAGDRWWGKGPDDIQFNDAAATKEDGQDRYFMSDVWSFLNKFFGGQDAKSNLQSTDPREVATGQLVPEPNALGAMNFGGRGDRRGRMNDQSGYVKPWKG